MAKRAGVVVRNWRASALLASTLTPMICRPLAPYLACISFIHGKDWRHGPHQEAQKSTYTTLPCSLASFTAPSTPCRSNCGAAAPFSSAHAGAALNAAASMAIDIGFMSASHAFRLATAPADRDGRRDDQEHHHRVVDVVRGRATAAAFVGRRGVACRRRTLAAQRDGPAAAGNAGLYSHAAAV